MAIIAASSTSASTRRPNDAVMRPLSPNERRCAVRESLGYYGSLVVAATYDFASAVDLASIYTYAHALRQCVLQHPQLSAAIEDAGTKASRYRFCARLDLHQHVTILDPVPSTGQDEMAAIAETLPKVLDERPPTAIPPWCVVIRPLSATRCLVAFAYSHALGDGMSGMAFHRTFVTHLQSEGRRFEKNDDLVCTPEFRALGPAFDTPANLPISWSFLLGPLLGTFLPPSLAKLVLGSKATLGATTPSTWMAAPHRYDAEKYATAVQPVSIDGQRLQHALAICRARGTKMTGLLHQFIVAALSQGLPASCAHVDNFAASTVINLRGAVGVSNDEMGNFVSTESHTLPRQTTVDWESARRITDQLAAASQRLRDISVGLLRYLSDLRPWMVGKLGQPRGCSYELSNLVSFGVSAPTLRCAVTRMILSQPGDVSGAPMTFNVVSVAGGPMTISINWQRGALALGSDRDEQDFVAGVGNRLVESFHALLATKGPGASG